MYIGYLITEGNPFGVAGNKSIVIITSAQMALL
jgi:hypothetical protein